MTSFKYRYILDRSSKKYRCPSCGKKSFVRFIDTETGEVLPDPLGRCDHEASCGYFQRPQGQKRTEIEAPAPTAPPKVYFIPFDVVRETLTAYDKNIFIQNLLKAFDPADVERVISLYYLGTIAGGFRAGAVTFPYIDPSGNVRAVQVKEFDENNHTAGQGFLHSMIETELKRQKQEFPEWLWDYAKNEKKVSCLFGGHLLNKYPSNPVALVEAPKTAIIGTLAFGFPDNPKNLLWCGVFNRSSLTLDKVKPLEGRNIYLFPDLSKDGNTFDLWKQRAKEFEQAMTGTKFTVSDYLETKAPEADKVKGDDLADFVNVENVKNASLKKTFFSFDWTWWNIDPVTLPEITKHDLNILTKHFNCSEKEILDFHSKFVNNNNLQPKNLN
jgi:hypothetical protein